MTSLTPRVLGAAAALLLAGASFLITAPPAYAVPSAQKISTRVTQSDQATSAAKPKITEQPVSTGGIVGRQVGFVVKAKRAKSFQWQRHADKDWTSVSGATSASLTLKVSTTNAGKYRVRVSNASGKVYSRTVVLTSYPMTIMVGHRGDMSAKRPEQTIPAFRAASKAGADMIEFDVRWTSDHKMVLMHDASLDRTTDCTGAVEKHTYKYVRSCDAGSYKGKKYAGTKVPTFAEVLTYAYKHSMRVNAEVKTQTMTVDQAKAYIAAINKAHMTGRAIMSSFSEASVATLRSVDPGVKIPTCWIDFGTPSISKITASGSTYYSSLITSFTPERVTAIHAAGVQILGGPAATYADYRQTEALHLDAIVVNSVFKYREWLDKQV